VKSAFHRFSGGWTHSVVCLEDKGEFPGSDMYVMACLRGQFWTVSYFFEDSFGKHWSSQWDVWDCEYDGVVTHWTELPLVP